MRNKYKNIKTIVDGITFDSRKEALRYSQLILIQKAGEIKCLQLQKKFELNVNNQKICTYKADFTYFDIKSCKNVVEDAKGMKTPVYNLKKKLMKAIYDIDIREV